MRVLHEEGGPPQKEEGLLEPLLNLPSEVQQEQQTQPGSTEAERVARSDAGG